MEEEKVNRNYLIIGMDWKADTLLKMWWYISYFKIVSVCFGKIFSIMQHDYYIFGYIWFNDDYR